MWANLNRAALLGELSSMPGALLWDKESGPMGNFRDLAVWNRAHHLALRIYAATARMPFHERFGLVAQLRRAAVSVASNIAEGAGRGRDGEFRAFLGVARGSLHELEAQLLLASDLSLIDRDLAAGLEAEIQETSRMLTGLIDHLIRAGAACKPSGSAHRLRRHTSLTRSRE